jgi:hypothetical protein
MKRLSLLVSVLALLLVVVAAPSTAGPPDGGFVLVDTDAAYASFESDDVPGVGYCSVFVGYVWAGTLKYFGGELIRPHSDLEVRFEDCGDLTGIGGVVPTVDEPDASIATLTEAVIDGVEVPMTDSINAVVDLTWTGVGEVVVEHFSDPTFHAHHRSRFADVTGAVTINIQRNGTLLTLIFEDDGLVVADPPEIWPKITHFNTVVYGNS